MRLSLLIILGICYGQSLAAEPLKLAGYQQADGAISIFQNGDNVDPYFAGKALLVAHDAGLDIRAAAASWIAWGLQHQRADGGFDRFCRRDGLWVACAAADADDSATAVWIELIAKLAPGAGLPIVWLESLKRAQQLLDSLRDQDSRIYFISSKQPVGLLMDNVEVYTALLALSQLKQTTGELEQASLLAKQADVLANTIVQVFWQPCLQRLRVSTQSQTRPGFYPDQVAEIFPILAGIRIPGRDQAGFFKQWLNENRGQWFKQAKVDFPWGLVAIAADKLAEHESVNCWLTLAAQLRQGSHWNVLEEAVIESLTASSAANHSKRGTCPITLDSAVTPSGRLLPPDRLVVSRIDPRAVELRWNIAGKGNKPFGYEIYRDGNYIGMAREPVYVDNSIAAGKRYVYTVKAYDGVGNISASSAAAAIAIEAGNFVTVYLESDAGRAKIRFRSEGSVSQDAVELPMDDACPRYQSKTLSLGNAKSISVAILDGNGTVDDNHGKNYLVGSGLFTIGRGGDIGNTDPCLDRMPPSAPEALAQIGLRRGAVDLAWKAARDNVAVARYKVVRNGAEIADIGETHFTDSCVAPITTYQYRIRAVDSAENQSASSRELIVTTPD
ncbi:carbohydrate binding domain-containing protein [Methylomonas sp. 2BW1-5-20]|uniref:carbohydrate binding domain-containing protein n=1 Tax=Methylomonas sp. 2BW1-5-20 TaxID=3376686 RepID=UPI00404FEF18